MPANSEVKTTRPRIIIVGAGFGGLYAAKALANKPVDVMLVDRNNYHTFQPLLYQVATAGLEVEEVTAPVRAIMRKARNIGFVLGEVINIDPQGKTLKLQTDEREQQLTYDYLILSPGTVTTYFGLSDVEKCSFGLKTLEEAITLRNHVLRMFERANTESDPAIRAALMTVVVVGGGPTGIEMSGALRELFQHVLRKDFPQLDLNQARVILVEATDRLLSAFPEALQKSALKQIQQLGVEVLLNKSVAQATSETVCLKDGTIIPTRTIVWAAGVQAEEIAGINVEPQKARRLATLPTLQLPPYSNIYVIGDANYLKDEQGNPYPQLAPVAMQQGILAASNILATLAGQPLKEFRYRDRGIMATIGRSKAVAWVFNKLPMTGFMAWIAWLVLHLIYLIGFRNRVNVLINWAWNYFHYSYFRSIYYSYPPHSNERHKSQND